MLLRLHLNVEYLRFLLQLWLLRHGFHADHRAVVVEDHVIIPGGVQYRLRHLVLPHQVLLLHCLQLLRLLLLSVLFHVAVLQTYQAGSWRLLPLRGFH